MRNSSGALLGTPAWKSVNVGGLGFVTGMAMAADSSHRKFIRTDVGGAYRWDEPSRSWVQIIKIGNLPIPDPLTVSSQKGVYENVIAPSDSTHWYMAFRDHMFRSTDAGFTFADDNLNGTSGLFMTSNDSTGGNVRTKQCKMQVDTINPDVVYCGLQNDGVWRRLSGAWAATTVPASPVSGNGGKIIIIAIDPTSANTGSGVTLRKSRIVASVAGDKLYESTDGGTTWADMASAYPMKGGGLTGFLVSAMFFDSAGTLWLVPSSSVISPNNLYKQISGTWSQVTLSGTTATLNSLTPDPKNINRMVGWTGSGDIIHTLNGGTSWISWTVTHNTAVTTNVPIIPQAMNANFAAGSSQSLAAVYPDPVDNTDWVPHGYGVSRFNTPLPVSGTTTLPWVEESQGIEELVANYAHINMNGTVILGSQDRALIRAVPTGYPASSFTATALDTGFGIDSAIDDPTWIAAIVNNETAGFRTALSQDEGQTWTVFAVQPTTKLGGSLAVGNKGNIVIVPGQYAHPKYTTNSGATWTECTFTGYTLPAEGTSNGFGFGTSNTRRHIITADKANPGTFYAYNCVDIGGVSRGIWKSTDNGATFNRVNTTLVINPLFIGFHNTLNIDRGILYICCGPTSSNYDGDTANISYRSEDGGVTWTAIGELYEINMLKIGAPAPQSSLHTLYAIGWKTIAGVQTFGLYQSLNKGVNWTLLNNNSTFDFAYAMAADPIKFGRIIIGYSGTGWAESNYSYTLLAKAA